MGLRDNAIRAIGRGFDTERRLINPGSQYLILLERDKTNDTGFKELKKYTKGFTVYSDSYRNQRIFEVATVDDLSTVMLTTGFIAYNGLLYEIDEGDITPPDDGRFTWMFRTSLRNTVYVPQ